jgi:hypothetical protein
MRRLALVSRIGRRARGVTVGLLLAVLGTLAISTPASAQNPNPGILPPNANAFGASYGEWNSRWWQWALSIPADRNPLTDTTGANCAQGQSGRVWFLAGTLGGGAVRRSCTVRPGTPLFFPIANSFCAEDPPGNTTTFEQQLACAKSFVVTEISAQVDGRMVQQLERYRVDSPSAFSLRIPANNVLGAPAGVYEPAAASGMYLLLSPLSVGAHVIHFRAVFQDGTIVDVTYNLTVSPRQSVGR